MATAAKPTSPKTANEGGGLSGIFPYVVIVVLFFLALAIYKFVFGASEHFVDGDNSKDPLPGDYFGTIYKGGFVVPILLTLFFIVITFVVERFITLGKAKGTGSIDGFVRTVRGMLDRGDISGALAACDKQKGAIANVVRAGLTKYAEMDRTTGMEKDEKVMAIQKEVEEATTLELPTLERNLNILATVASIATLMGLFGTVLGMIRSFAAMSSAGAPDSTALATGISEALINTALGIGTSALAIIAYNFFTSRIDSMTYRIDEAGYSLTQTYATKGN
jgi:biopolymer transport protein ExbB